MPLYDTSIFIGHIRGNPMTRWAFKRLRDREWTVAVSSVTVYELYLGCLISKQPTEHRATVESYLARVPVVLTLDEMVARRAAEIQARLRRSNQMLDDRDLFIAATALVHNLSICTLDIDHFSRVPDLILEPLS
jgi:tRNA(fMet)-specific endonuclease VapC